jgi:hypothetical protein
MARCVEAGSAEEDMRDMRDMRDVPACRARLPSLLACLPPAMAPRTNAPCRTISPLRPA